MTKRKRKTGLQRRLGQFRRDQPLYLAMAAVIALLWVILNAQSGGWRL